MASNTISFDLDAGGKKIAADLGRAQAKVEKLEAAGKKAGSGLRKAKGEAAKLRKELAATGRAAGKTGDRAKAAGDRAGRGFRNGAMGVLKMTGALVGAGSLSMALMKVLDLGKQTYTNLKKLESLSFDQQRTDRQATTAFLSNNMQAPKDELDALLKSARAASQILGGKNAYPRTIKGLQDIRANTSGAPAELQQAALLEAVGQGALDPATDVGLVGEGVVKAGLLLAKEKGLDPAKDAPLLAQMAANQSAEFGSMSGGTIVDVQGQIGPLSALPKTSGNTLGEIEAFHSIFTSKLKMDAAAATTITTTLLAKMKRDLTITSGGKKRNIVLAGENSIDMLTGFLERVNQDEFGSTRDDQKEAMMSFLGQLGRKSGPAILGAATIREIVPELESRMTRLNAAPDIPGSMRARTAALAIELDPSIGIVRNVDIEQAKLEASRKQNAPGGERAAAEENILSFQERLGIIDPMEDKDSKLKALREIRSRIKGQSGRQFEGEEKLRLFKEQYPFIRAVQGASTLNEAVLRALTSVRDVLSPHGGLQHKEQFLLSQAGIPSGEIAQLGGLGQQGLYEGNMAPFAARLERAKKQAVFNLKVQDDPDVVGSQYRAARNVIQAFERQRQAFPQGVSSETAVLQRRTTPGELVERRVGLALGRGVEGPQEGVPGLRAASREAYTQGLVDPSDGLSRVELAIVRAMGANTAQIEELQRALPGALAAALEKLAEGQLGAQAVREPTARKQDVD